jgi:sugar lactone lactonase YvrE
MRTAAAATLLAAVATGCSSDDDEGAATTTSVEATSSSTTEVAAEPLADQTPPPSINGLVVDGDTIWIASIAGDEVVQIDRATGALLARFPADGATPDDVAVDADGTVWVTGFGDGSVARIADGTYEVVTTTGVGVNPVDIGPDGTVYVATWGEGGTLWTIDPASGEATVVAEDLPDVNGFAVQPDGTVLAPSGGLRGPGAVVRIDPADGSVTTVVDELPPVLASAAAPDGAYIVLANATGERFEVDAETGTATSLGTVDGGPFDNLAFGADGTLYLSSFIEPLLVVVSPDGEVSTLPIGG